MQLTNRETRKIMPAENPEEVRQIFAGAKDIASRNGAEPLTDHAKCFSPAPDTVIRVCFACKPLQNSIEIEPQELTAPERNGFTAAEWGGTLLK